MARVLVVLLLLLAGASPARAGSSFSGIGQIGAQPLSAPRSSALAVSPDGSVVVGRCSAYYGGVPCRWTSGQLEMLGPDATYRGSARDVSTGGRVIVGDQSVGPAFRWEDGVVTDLVNPDASSVEALAITPDGSTIVGTMEIGGEGLAFRLRDGLYEAMPQVGASPSYDRALGVSADGSVLVGGTGDGRAARWTNGVADVLAPLAGAVSASAHAISADGQVVVGFSGLPNGDHEATVWRNGVAGSLGDLPGGDFWSSVSGISGDGATIVGSISTAFGREAFLWTADRGMRRVLDALADEYGVSAPGWTLTIASDASDDGRVIVGTGINPAGEEEGWVAVLETPACRNGVDDDGDGLVDFGADDGCASPLDDDEGGDCANGRDDDGDGLADFPADPGCSDRSDGSELSADLPCDDGLDDDGDFAIDFPDDSGCSALTGLSEAPECSDDIDNDGDGLIDGIDQACEGPWGLSETLRPVYAADLASPGDEALTVDPNSGLEWLDLTWTLGLGYDEVEAGAGGWLDAGWRHATAGEVCRLEARLPPDASLACDTYPVGYSVEPFHRLLGITGTDVDLGVWAQGIFGPDASLPAIGSLVVRYQPATDFSSIGYDTADASPTAGHFLVRPAPAACANGVDDDGDGWVDAPADPGCRDAADASEGVDCADGIDNDRDGFVDYPADRGCRDAAADREDPACDDRIDNDGDGFVDASEDVACDGSAWGGAERRDLHCGLGAELALLLVALEAVRRGRRRRSGWRAQTSSAATARS